MKRLKVKETVKFPGYRLEKGESYTIQKIKLLPQVVIKVDGKDRRFIANGDEFQIQVLVDCDPRETGKVREWIPWEELEDLE